MGRYESNIMTYVRPTNYKLIDRSARYVIMLRPQSKYDEVVRTIYEIKKTIKADVPIVLKVIEILNDR
jgi:N-acetylmuramic acid 6-phosphate etherase